MSKEKAILPISYCSTKSNVKKFEAIEELTKQDLENLEKLDRIYYSDPIIINNQKIL